MPFAEVIPLRCWQDPQGDVVLVYSEHECFVYFACWETAAQPADYICQLSFDHAAVVRGFGREFAPFKTPEHHFHSYVLLVPDSELYRAHVSYRQAMYPQWPGPALNHYVVVGHDIYHEVLAAGFTETLIPIADLTDERLLRLLSDD